MTWSVRSDAFIWNRSTGTSHEHCGRRSLRSSLSTDPAGPAVTRGFLPQNSKFQTVCVLTMVKFILSSLLLLLLLLVDGTAFVPPQYQRILTRVFATVDVEAASTKLLWEILEEQAAKPILNLSGIEDAPSEESVEEDTSEWDDGQRWEATEKALRDLDIECGEFLDKCPQLYRLETSAIVSTAEWLMEEGLGTAIQAEPRVLSYKCDDVQYGSEFLLNMMMGVPISPALADQLLLSGIDGGLQERAAKAALGNAGDATYKANQQVAGDAAATLNALKNRKRM